VHPNLVVDGLNISIRRVEYDRESEASGLLRSGLPHAGRFCSPDHRGGRLGAAKRVIMVGARQPHAGTLHQLN
jgi:hypothetical protein